MKQQRTCPQPIPLNRRDFLKNALAASAVGAGVAGSFEEAALRAADAPSPSPAVAPRKMPTGKIRHLELSRLICGGNLITGYAHARDLIYVSTLLKEYFTDAKILDTWQTCEAHGINTMIVHPSDERAVALYKRYRKERGGKLHWLAQAGPSGEKDMSEVIQRAVDDGAAGVFLLGNQGDRWTFDRRLDLIGKFVELVNRQGVISGVGGHSLEMVQAVEAAGIKNDFYMKTLHDTRYWSTRRPDQTKAVIENYSSDNYFDLEPEKTIAFMKGVKKAWIAYKVLAAGALHPRVGFDHAFANGADFICVGMFDFQVAEDAAIAGEIVPKYEERRREWFA